MQIAKQIKSAQKLQGGTYLWGAHHPHCDRYHNHLLWIAGHPFCLGCVCMYTGIIVGLPLTFMIEWSEVSFVNWILFNCLLLIPTILQTRIQIKSYKIVSRLLLGISISMYFISGLFFIELPIDPLLFRCLIISAFIIVYRLLKKIRSLYSRLPCDDCPLGYFPTCEWNLPRLLAENSNDDVLVQALSNDKLQHLVVKNL